MKVTINSSLLSQLKPGKKPYDVRDDKLTGFMIRVNISGKLLYMCEYDRGKRIQISRVGVITPTQARDRALAILSEAAQGIDPRAKTPYMRAHRVTKLRPGSCSDSAADINLFPNGFHCASNL